MTDRQTAAAVVVLLLAAAGGLAIGAPAVAPGEVARSAGEVGAGAGGNLTIWFCDVGQGDANLIRMPNGRYWLLDAGPAAGADDLIGQLRAAGVRSLSAATITHSHLDHYGGMREALEVFPAGKVQPGRLDPNVSVLLIPHNRPSDDLNDKSQVYRLTYGAAAVLLTGDATARAETEMIEEGAGRLRADVLKVGHHGAADATSAAFLAAVDPSLAVISVGAGNFYGHPAPWTVNRIRSTGAAVVRTDQDGWTRATTDGTAWTVTTENGGYWYFIANES